MNKDFWNAEDVAAVMTAEAITEEERHKIAIPIEALKVITAHCHELICVAPRQTSTFIRALAHLLRKSTKRLHDAACMQQATERRVARREEMEIEFLERLKSL